MITMILLPIAALYVVLLIWVGRKLKSWSARSIGLLFLLSPVIYMVGSYQYVHYRHKQDCAREGGLKVLVRPHKADRIRLDAESLIAGDRPEFLLHRYYPLLSSVEAWDGKYTGQGKTGYFDYSIDPATLAQPKRDWKVTEIPCANSIPHTYELSKHSLLDESKEKIIFKLSFDANPVATWTMFSHYWSRNGAMNIGWQCFYKDAQERGPESILVELILK